MSRNVTFYLGPASGLTARRLVITRIMEASDKLTRPAASYVGTLAGTDETVTVNLANNRMWQAVLRDYRSTGESSRLDVLNFHTGSLLFPGPSSGDRLRVLSMEDLSSSSSASSLSASSSSSSSISTSSSVSSLSSSSGSSASSISASSSSQSMSPSSASSASSSSSSASSSSSSSASESSASMSQSSSSSSSSGLPT